jgi:uncharacterized protein (DUF433 family)
VATLEEIDLTDIITCSPEVMSGAPVFAGTRVPVKVMWEYLASGESLDAFLEDFPTVTREQALHVVRVGGEHLLADLGTR